MVACKGVHFIRAVFLYFRYWDLFSFRECMYTVIGIGKKVGKYTRTSSLVYPKRIPTYPRRRYELLFLIFESYRMSVMIMKGANAHSSYDDFFLS